MYVLVCTPYMCVNIYSLTPHMCGWPHPAGPPGLCPFGCPAPWWGLCPAWRLSSHPSPVPVLTQACGVHRTCKHVPHVHRCQPVSLLLAQAGLAGSEREHPAVIGCPGVLRVCQAGGRPGELVRGHRYPADFPVQWEVSGGPADPAARLCPHPTCHSPDPCRSLSPPARIIRSRQWCAMHPCLETEGCDLLINRSGWTCTQPGGRVKTTTVGASSQGKG